MIKGDEWFMIRHLKREGLSISEIARRTGHDRKTIRKVIKGEAQPVYKQRPRRASKLGPYKTYVKARMDAGMSNAVKMLKEIRAMGYTGGISILKEFMGPHRRKAKAVQRYETPPGEQAQVDWGTCGKIYQAGILRTVYCFVMTLGYSRMTYVEFTLRCDTRAFIRGHINAFSFFGGVVKTCLYDNLKSVKLATLDDGVRLNPTFADFADTFGFIPKICRPYRPETKGKVESGIRYVKGNFLLGETFCDLNEMNAHVLGWLSTVANRRIHGTTGEVPLERFEEEGLAPIRAGMVFDTTLYQRRKITRDCLVSYQGCRYSVPYRFAGREAMIKDYENGLFDVLVDGELATTHRLSPFKRKTIMVASHYQGITMDERLRAKRLPLLNPVPQVAVEERDLIVYETHAGAAR